MKKETQQDTKYKNALEQTKAVFSRNLKNLLLRKGISQKVLGIELNVAASTISSYINGSKLPTCDFLVRLKMLYPEISIDDLLTGDILPASGPEPSFSESVAEADLHKYLGAYYSYYLDTNKKVHNPLGEINTMESVIKKGILYIYENAFSANDSEILCLAAFGTKNTSAKKIKSAVENLQAPAKVESYLQKHYSHHLYKGTVKFSQSHIFLTLNQIIDQKDMVFIILHRVRSTKAEYLGGLGTINSVSTGRTPNPVVQLIGFSRHDIRLSDEEIKAQLRFSSPSISMNMNAETDDILKLAEKLYGQDLQTEEQDKDSFRKYIPDIIRSNIKLLVDKSIEESILWYGKVTQNADDEWFHILKHSSHQETDEEDDSTENSNTDNSRGEGELQT